MIHKPKVFPYIGVVQPNSWLEFPDFSAIRRYNQSRILPYLSGFEISSEGECMNFILSDGSKTNRKCDYGKFSTVMIPEDVLNNLTKVESCYGHSSKGFDVVHGFLFYTNSYKPAF